MALIQDKVMGLNMVRESNLDGMQGELEPNIHCISTP